jgi:dynactin complex subunit
MYRTDDFWAISHRNSKSVQLIIIQQCNMIIVNILKIYFSDIKYFFSSLYIMYHVHNFLIRILVSKNFMPFNLVHYYYIIYRKSI